MKRLRTILIITWSLVLALGGGIAYLAMQGKLPAFTVEDVPTLPSPLPVDVILTLSAVPETQSPLRLATVTPTITQTPTVTATFTPGYTEQPMPGIDPLTGLRPANPALLERRAIAVKITNFPRYVREVQSGLTLADVVYEYYIEDGISRFIAVFYGNDASRAGPVRSGRYFDGHIAHMYQSILVFANADDRVERQFIDSDLLPYLFVERSDNCPPLCRDGRIKGFNNLFLDTTGVAAFLKYRNTDNERQPLRSTYFSDNFLSLPTQAIDTIYTFYSAYSYNYWEYDPNQNLYLRYSDTTDMLNGSGEHYAPHIDQLTGQQVSASNVVELLVPHNFRNDYDRADQVFDIDLTGEGPAYIFRNGRMFLGTWIRDEIGQPIKLVDVNGYPVGLLPGQTYYEVINPESNVSIDGPNIQFTFYIPPRWFTPTPTPTKFKPTPTPRKKP